MIPVETRASSDPCHRYGGKNISQNWTLQLLVFRQRRPSLIHLSDSFKLVFIIQNSDRTELDFLCSFFDLPLFSLYSFFVLPLFFQFSSFLILFFFLCPC